MNESMVRVIAVLSGTILVGLGIVYDQSWGMLAGFFIATIPFMD